MEQRMMAIMRAQLLEHDNKEIRIKRKTRKAVCQFKKSDGQSVGLGCLLSAPQVKVKHFSKFFILTTTKVIPNSDFSEGEYEVEFAKGSTSKTFDLKSITKSVLVRLASGLAVIFLNLGCSELNHHWCFRSKKCTLLSKSFLTTADQNKVKQFCYIGNKCYNHVESNGRDILEVDDTESNSTTGSNDFPEENCNGSVILAVIDGKVKAVGIFNIQSDTQEPKVISPVWIKSRIDAIFEEPPPDTGETPPSDTGQLSPGTEKAPPAATGAPSADIGEPPAGTGESPPEQAEEPSAADTADGLIQTIPRRGAGERSDLTSGSDAPLENTDGSKVKPKSDAEPEADPTQTGQVAGEPPGIQEGVDTADCGSQAGLHPQAGFQAFFAKIQEAATEGFENLLRVCTSIECELPPLELADDIDFTPNEIDYPSQEIMPEGKKTSYVAVKTNDDGNCFFRAASILAFGHQNRHEEMRVRIVIELASHRADYLNNEDIVRMIKETHRVLHRSDKTVNLENDSAGLIETLFEAELLDITRPLSWATDFSLGALGAVLNCRVECVCPEINCLNAVIRPQLYDREKEPVLIMWTQIGGGTTPNHFVPLIPAEKIPSFRNNDSRSGGPVPVERMNPSMEYINPLKEAAETTVDKRTNSGGKTAGCQIEDKSKVQSGGNATQLEVQSEANKDADTVKIHSEVKPNVQSGGSTARKKVAVEQTKEIEYAAPDQLRRLSTEASDIPIGTFSKVCLKLNIKDDMHFKDFRLLGEKMGFSKEETRKLEQGKRNPADELLQMWGESNPQPTVEKLIELLKENDMQRIDVAQILQNWVQGEPHTRSSTRVTDIPYSIYGKVCLKLNTKDNMNFKDFRLLGEKMGFSKEETRKLEQESESPNPTAQLLEMWCKQPNSESTVRKLIELLKEEDLGRMDVVKIIEDWVQNRAQNK